MITWKTGRTERENVISHPLDISPKTYALPICTWFFFKSSWKNHVRWTGFLVYFELGFYCLCFVQKAKIFLILYPPVWKLHNPYCHNVYQMIEILYDRLYFQNLLFPSLVSVVTVSLSAATQTITKVRSDNPEMIKIYILLILFFLQNDQRKN